MIIFCPGCSSIEVTIEGVKPGSCVDPAGERIFKYKRLMVRHKGCRNPLSADDETRFTVIVNENKL